MKKLFVHIISVACLLATTGTVQSQGIYVVTVDGDYVITEFPPDGVGHVFASDGLLNYPTGLAFDQAGNLYVANAHGSTVEKFTPDGVGSIFVGLTNQGGPFSLAFDANGNLYASGGSGIIDKTTPTGNVSVFASGVAGVGFPGGLAFDSSGNLYSDAGDTIEEFSTNGVASVFTNGLNDAAGLAFDTNGNLYALDGDNGLIKKFTPSGVGSIFATGLSMPRGIAVDNTGNIYVACSGDGTIQKFTPTGSNSVFASGLHGPMAIAINTNCQLPVILSQPQTVEIDNGFPVSFSVTAWCPKPLSYQWQKGGANLMDSGNVSGTTCNTLALSATTSNDAGGYAVIVSNSCGSVTSSVAMLQFCAPALAVVFSTGVDCSGNLLPAGQTDPHYTISSSPTGAVPAITAIPNGMWVANSPLSGWINASGNGNQTELAGEYVYTLRFSLSGFDPSSVTIAGEWTADNAARILLNGADTGISTPENAYGAMYPFTITSGFLAGSNEIQFVVTNYPGSETNPEGLQVEILSVTAQPSVFDGIPDSWRAQYFANQPPGNSSGAMTNNLSCAACDADGTGQNNLFKYLAGLDPTNPASVFALSIASVTNAPREFNLLFSPVVAGRIYTPQFCTDLVGAAWAPLTGFSGPTTNPALSQVTITDTNPILPQEFYRINISLATNQAPAPVTFTITPSTVNNQYAGAVTLQVGGLTNGETVLVQKYRDSNADGAVDAGDRLVQQFNLTDGQAGMVIGGVTNVNVPGDTDTVPGQITAPLNFQVVGIVQATVAHYLFVLSSPTGRFAPLTNLFTVTDAVSAQTFTGAVLSGGVPLTDAVVYVFMPGTAVAIAGTVADNSGNYSIGAPPGTYALYAFKSNYVCTAWAAPILTLGAGATVTTNLNLLPATCSISGQVVDANNPSQGLPGMFMAAVSTDGLIVLGFTDADGNFNLPVTAGLWAVSVKSESFVALGYLGLQNWPGADTTGGSVTGITIALPKAAALFYGTVQDAQNYSLAGFDLAGDDCDGACLFQGDAVTDTNGYYVMAVNADLWSAYPGMAVPGYANYIFSQMSQTNVSAGQAVLENFLGILATNQIAGYVKNVAGNPLANVGVNASATVNGNDFSNWVQTDGTGYYSINIGNATWTVGICCADCDPNLDLTAVGYQCANSRSVPISDNDAVVNFTLQPASFQAWQTIYFGTTNNPEAAAAFDADGTGQNNQFKYVAGLDPTNPASVFALRIANVSGVSTQKYLIYSPVATGRTYTVQFSTNLVGGAYTNLTGFSGPLNSGTQATVTDLGATQPTKFYRVNISLP
jgi:hypothetical protein